MSMTRPNCCATEFRKLRLRRVEPATARADKTRIDNHLMPRWGNARLARIDIDDVQAHCRTALAGYKVPRSITIVDTIERNPAGKADYKWAGEVASSNSTQ